MNASHKLSPTRPFLTIEEIYGNSSIFLYFLILTRTQTYTLTYLCTGMLRKLVEGERHFPAARGREGGTEEVREVEVVGPPYLRIRHQER